MRPACSRKSSNAFACGWRLTWFGSRGMGSPRAGYGWGHELARRGALPQRKTCRIKSKGSTSEAKLGDDQSCAGASRSQLTQFARARPRCRRDRADGLLGGFQQQVFDERLALVEGQADAITAAPGNEAVDRFIVGNDEGNSAV